MTGRGLIAGLRGGLLAGLLVGAAAGPAAAQPVPGRDDYAWRFPLTGGSDAEYRSAELTAEVYRSVSDAALRDIGVYNAAGQAVPRIVQAPRSVPEAPEQTVNLGLVPLFGPPAEQREQLLLILHGGGPGASVAVDTRPGAGTDTDGAGPRLAAYVVDLRGIDEPFKALQFGWADGPDGFIGTVRVETGDDLQNWQQLGSGALARLAYEDTTIERNRVELRGRQGDFLRLTWADLPADWALQSLTGIRRPDATLPARDGLTLDPVEVSDDGRTLTFDAGGFPPVEQAGLLLPGDNVVVRARLRVRAGGDDRWRPVHEGVFYHLRRDGVAVASGSVPVDRTRAALWQVQILSGAVSGDLRLRLGWQPERLIFVAQGEGPFELAVGRARDRQDSFPQERLLGDPAIFRMLERGSVAGEATLGTREALAGPEALAADERVFWRTVMVWGALIGAVLVVAWLVLSLLREMQRIPPTQAGGGEAGKGPETGKADGIQSDRVRPAESGPDREGAVGGRPDPGQSDR